MLKISSTEIPEVKILECEIKKDNRGIKYTTYSKKELEEAGMNAGFVEETLYCLIKKGTLYGIHFQNNPKAQAKLLYCTKGRGLDFAIDLRHNSKTYKKWVSVELSEQNRKQIFIPKGFGHAFLSIEDETHIILRIDNYFDPKLQRSISYKDSDLQIAFGVVNPILSKQDRDAPFLKDSDCNL